MRSPSDLTRIFWRHSLFVGAVIAALAGAAHAAGTAASTDDTGSYRWSAELVSFEPRAGTVAVKARVERHADIGDLPALAAGDRVMLTWSGIFDAAGIRSLSANTTDEPGRFTMPVEFVSSEMDGRYVTFRVPIPADDVARIEALEPGTWITATSPHHPSSFTETVTTIRGYNDVS